MANIKRARQLRRDDTWAERLMWRWLRDRRFSQYKFRRQCPVGSYYLDFYCDEASLNIELDGSQHGFPEQQQHDAARDKYLLTQGIKTLRFWNSRLRREPQSVRDAIFEELQKRAPHPLPEYTRPMMAPKKSWWIARPHPGPLLQGEGETLPAFLKHTRWIYHADVQTTKTRQT